MEEKSRICLTRLYGVYGLEVGKRKPYESWSVGIEDSNRYVPNINNIMHYLDMKKAMVIKQVEAHGGEMKCGDIAFMKKEDAEAMIEYLRSIELMKKLRGGEEQW